MRLGLLVNGNSKFTVMVEYGYINESGYLRIKELTEKTEQYREGKVIKKRIVSIEEQANKLLTQGWKPVDKVDESKLQAEDGYFVRIIPFDAGDRISYRYEKVIDEQKKRREIEKLKNSLKDTDYKVIKCYEASLLGEQMPYDVKNLHNERQNIRNRINELQSGDNN